VVERKEEEGNKMNIKVPSNLKSPTVIIVGQQDTPEKNDKVSKQMDLLEKKLDQQYKTFLDGKDYIQLIENLHKSFMQRLDKIVSSNKNLISEINSKKVSDLRNELNVRIDDLKKESSNDNLLKSFAVKLSSLEKTIKAIPERTVETRVVNRGISINTAMEKMLQRLEIAIKSARPKMIPYVS